MRRGDVVGDLCLIERALEPKSEHGGGLVTSLYDRPAEVAARARLLAAWNQSPADVAAIHSGTTSGAGVVSGRVNVGHWRSVAGIIPIGQGFLPR